MQNERSNDKDDDEQDENQDEGNSNGSRQRGSTSGNTERDVQQQQSSNDDDDIAFFPVSNPRKSHSWWRMALLTMALVWKLFCCTFGDDSRGYEEGAPDAHGGTQ